MGRVTGSIQPSGTPPLKSHPPLILCEKPAPESPTGPFLQLSTPFINTILIRRVALPHHVCCAIQVGVSAPEPSWTSPSPSHPIDALLLFPSSDSLQFPPIASPSLHYALQMEKISCRSRQLPCLEISLIHLSTHIFEDGSAFKIEFPLHCKPPVFSIPYRPAIPKQVPPGILSQGGCSAALGSE